jgi:hypothetical protein
MIEPGRPEPLQEWFMIKDASTQILVAVLKRMKG